MTIKENIPRIIIQSAFKVTVNAINGKIRISKNIIILVDDIKYLLSQFSDNRLKY